MASSKSTLSVDKLVERAIAGEPLALQRMLASRGGLPGPRPNMRLAIEAARALRSSGAEGEALLERFRALGPDVAPESVADSFLPVVGVVSLTMGNEVVAERMALLADHAEDPRRAVRTAVVLALRRWLNDSAAQEVLDHESWKEGYFQAAALLRAVGNGPTLQQLETAEPILRHVDASFELLRTAPRAHRRSHGYRDLARALSEAVPAIGKRFVYETVEWLQEHANETSPDLRKVLDEIIDGLRRAGLRPAEIDVVHRALRQHDAPPRDPRSDVGPTRRRGKNSRRRR